MEYYGLDRLLMEGAFKLKEVLDFCNKLGFKSYEDFHQTLINDYELRVD